jgi:hypothetical protein
MIYDRIDLKVTGTWANNFRPNGVTIAFGNNIVGGDVYPSLTNVVLPYGAIVGAAESVLSAANCSTGFITTGGVGFTSIDNVFIPYGVRFAVSLTIDTKTYPAGVFKCTDSFQMNTIQLVDVNKKAIFSVHNVDTDELITFTRPTANISRLILYKAGIGVDTTVFACYSVVFRTNVTAADVKAFNLLHPSDVNAIVVDDGSVLNSQYIIPV